MKPKYCKISVDQFLIALPKKRGENEDNQLDEPHN